MRDCYRPLLLFAQSMKDPKFAHQIDELRSHASGVKERDIIIVPIISRDTARSHLPADLPNAKLSYDEIGAAKKRFGVTSDSFRVILVGKDGSQKLSRKVPVSFEELSRLVDSMPMRKQEIMRRSPGATVTLASSAYQPDRPELAEVFAAARRSGNFDGVAVITIDGKTVLTSALGFSDRKAKIPMGPETVFRLGSLTKQVTALLVMQQVSGGCIRLDQTAGSISKSLPESSGRVTIRQLLSHVSGLPNPSDGRENAVPDFYLRIDPSAGDMTKSALGFCSGKPKREPGGRFEYNNCDYIVLGALLEALSGESYAELMRERVIQPLELKSWVVAPSDPELAPDVAVGYQEDGSVEPVQNPATYGAAGALLGNALDVAKWNNALLSHRLLSAEATDTMFRADPKLYGEALGSWAYDSEVANPPMHVIERQGDIGSTSLLSLLLPGKNASIVIIANTDRADLFNTYSHRGLGYEALKAGFRAK
jgi:CubicO group peptidase (beta-lactamase class C family)